MKMLYLLIVTVVLGSTVAPADIPDEHDPEPPKGVTRNHTFIFANPPIRSGPLAEVSEVGSIDIKPGFGCCERDMKLDPDTDEVKPKDKTPTTQSQWRVWWNAGSSNCDGGDAFVYVTILYVAQYDGDGPLVDPAVLELELVPANAVKGKKYHYRVTVTEGAGGIEGSLPDISKIGD